MLVSLGGSVNLCKIFRQIFQDRDNVHVKLEQVSNYISSMAL